MTSHVLITGGTGFLGLHVTHLLIEGGSQVTLAGRSQRYVPMGTAGFEEVDGLERGALCDTVLGGHFDTVVHLAALANTTEAERDPVRAQRLNALWPGELAAAAAEASVAFVHASTDLVFGGNPSGHTSGFKPNDLPAPMGCYGESKAAGEVAVLAAHAKALVVRVPLLFGDSFGRGLGASDGLFRALDCGESVRLFTDEQRSPLDAAAAAHGIVLLLESRVHGLWHLAGRSISRFDLGHSLCHATGRDPRGIEPVSHAELGPEALRASDARLDASATRTRLPSLCEILDSGSAPAFSKS